MRGAGAAGGYDFGPDRVGEHQENPTPQVDEPMKVREGDHFRPCTVDSESFRFGFVSAPAVNVVIGSGRLRCRIGVHSGFRGHGDVVGVC